MTPEPQEVKPTPHDLSKSYPAVDDDPALRGLRQPEPMTAAEAEAAGEAEAWGGRGPSASYAEWLAEGQKELEAIEWDSEDPNAYQTRVEAGLEPEAEP